MSHLVLLSLSASNPLFTWIPESSYYTPLQYLWGGRMPHSPEDKKRVLTRVRRIRGQVDALERALESGEPCLAILQQIAAVRGAANGLMGEMVEIHLKDELVTGETTADQRAVRMAEVGHLLRSYLK